MENTSSPSAASSPEAPARKRRPPRRVEVSRVEILSPAMRRITLTGAELEGFPPVGPASYIKLIFPEPGQTEPTRPLPDGPRAVSMRTYTPLAVRPEALEVDVDFVLHGEGPASTWATQARVGQVLYLMGPGPGYAPDAGSSHHLLLADDSALPAVETILAALPASARAQVLLEVISAAEERPLHSAAQLDVSWLVRGTDHRLAGQPLAAALHALAPVGPDTRIYLACEAAAMRRLRLQLVEVLGVNRSQIVGRGYWKLDVINHPDHDYGDDG
ncbi:MAG: siderophore-interacting protein [Polaromonas sp.]|uniref:siderophore-interacting protein n=1 Tax=Polaromonas sp. TaxID=1869339 RepID=UPI0027321B84|nr:siderophore-interacting protein [Polaromonas sp.]MDP1741364.1 siderophore-interacting protein [Polaromonas sp.]MDP1955129.1 siderophore-interacting protein [Polaromonas sp.]MDP3752086.1 siderophore-interacting protein [Polaromonas sp.]